jgi:hypothetical protein
LLFWSIIKIKKCGFSGGRNPLQKYFNVAGPCVPGEHYMLPAQDQCPGVLDLIAQKHYFVIHAARQSGKTTLLQELADQLNAEGRYYALYCSLESVDKIPGRNGAFRQLCGCSRLKPGSINH